MFRFESIALLTLIPLLMLGVVPVSSEEDHRYSPGQFERPERDEWQKVDEVIEAMDLKKGDAIADIGCGSGYFTRPFARAVGPHGVVYGCDIATNLLEYLQDEAKNENLMNIVTVYAAMDRPMLPPKSVDTIFFCNTNHHLQDRVNYYRGLHDLLREGGQIVVVDWKNIEQEVGPPPHHTMSKQRVLTEMEEAGWQLVREETLLDYQYFLFFEPADVQ